MCPSDSGNMTLNETLIWEQGLCLFALTTLSEDNPFRKAIEEQAARTFEELLRVSSVGSRNPLA